MEKFPPVTVEELKQMHAFSKEEVYYIDLKFDTNLNEDGDSCNLINKDGNKAGYAFRFEHPITLEPCVKVVFNNGRVGYVSLAVGEEVLRDYDAAKISKTGLDERSDNRPST